MISWQAHSSRVAGLAFDPPGQRLVTVPTAYYDGTSGYKVDPVTVWDTAGNRVRDFASAGGAADFSPDGKRLVNVEYDRVNREVFSLRVWDVATGDQRHDQRHEATTFREVIDVRVLPDGSVLVATDRQVLRFHADLSGSPEKLPGRPQRPPKASRLAVAPGGTYFAGVGKTRATVWDANGVPLAYRDHSKSPQNGPAAFHPLRPVLAVGHGTVVDLWDFQSGEVVTLVGHKKPVWAVGFGPDGGTAYTAASDGAVIAWDADAGTVRQRFDFGTGKLYSAAVSPDGLTLALGGDDGRVTVVDVG